MTKPKAVRFPKFFPSIKELARILTSYKRDLDVALNDNKLDVRLAIDTDRCRFVCGYYLFTGLPDYDPVHTQVCAASVLLPNTNTRELARELLLECLDQIGYTEDS